MTTFVMCKMKSASRFVNYAKRVNNAMKCLRKYIEFQRSSEEFVTKKGNK